MNRLAPLALVACCLTATGCSPPQVVTDAGSFGAAAGTEFCRSVAAPADCPAPGYSTCGVCVRPPIEPPTGMNLDRLARTRCSELSRAMDSACDRNTMPGAPNLACVTGVDPANPPMAPTSRTVTVWGAVDVYDRGGDTANVTVQIMEVGADGAPGAVAGQAVTNPSLYSELISIPDSAGNIVVSRTLAGFKIANIQTDHRYVVRTIGPADTFGHAVYDYGLAIRGADVDMVTVPPALLIASPTVYIRPRVVANQDWVDLPGAASLVDGVPPGRAIILGEVRDCDDMRLRHATVYASPAPGYVYPAYFGPDGDHLVPDPALTSHGTGPSGGFALLSVAPGPVRVSAAGYTPEGAFTVVGTHAVGAFADSVTLVTFRGLSPWQYQTP